MPRNSSGVYSLPNPPVVTNTTIDSADENDTRDDLANELTNSLDRGGRGAMTAALKIVDGSAASPGVQFSSDANNGFFRNSADNWSASVGSVEQLNFSDNGVTLFSYRLTPLSPAQITSNQNDYAPANFSTASMLRLDTDAARNLTGLAGGTTGRVIDIHYIGSTTLTLKDDDASSTAANRFALPADLVLGPDMSVRLVYDATSARWRMNTGAVSSAMAPFTMAASVAAAVGQLGLGDLAMLDTVGTSQIDADAVTDPKIAASTAQTLTDGANVAWSVATAHVGNWTIGGNRTLDNPSGQKRGRTYILNVTQDGTGGRTITFGSNYVGVNSAVVPQPNPTAGTTTTYVFVSHDGTKLQLIYSASSGTPSAVGRNIAARTNSATPNSKFDITADELIVTDAGGFSMKLRNVSVTVDMAVSGANGLDTGSEASNTWYYGWVLAKADGTVCGVASTSASAPTLPSGYTFKALVTAVRNNGSSNFIPYRQFGNVVQYVERQTLLSGGSSTSEANIATTSFVPSIAGLVQVEAEHTLVSGAGAAQSTAALKIVTGQAILTAHPYCGFGSDTDLDSVAGWLPNEGQNIIYQLTNGGSVSSASLSVYALSFTLPIGGQ